MKKERKKVPHLPKKRGSELKYISKSQNAPNFSYSFPVLITLKVNSRVVIREHFCGGENPGFSSRLIQG
jgi:hypothetical protein